VSDFTGQSVQRQIIITPDQTPTLTDGTNFIIGNPVILPATTNGVVTNLWPWNYTVVVQGFQRIYRITVPSSTTILRAASLVSGYATLVNQNMLLGVTSIAPGSSNVSILPAQGTGTVSIAVATDTNAVLAIAQSSAGGGSATNLTPLRSDIDAAGHSLTNMETAQAANFAATENGAFLQGRGHGFRLYPPPGDEIFGSIGLNDLGNSSFNNLDGYAAIRSDTNDVVLIYDHNGNLMMQIEKTNATHQALVTVASPGTVAASSLPGDLASWSTIPTNLLGSAASLSGVSTQAVIVDGVTNQFLTSSSAVSALTTNSLKWHVTVSGSPAGDGTTNAPIDLLTALGYNTSSPVQPGDTVWIHGGHYIQAEFGCFVSGNANNPIIFRNWNGQYVELTATNMIGDGSLYTYPTATNIWFWGLTADGAWTNRFSATDQTYGFGPAGIVAYGPQTKVINCVSHDNANGISVWSSAIGAEVYGNIVFNTGYGGTARPHGHSFYLQNASATPMTVQNNVDWGAFEVGFQIYTASGQIQNVNLLQNVIAEDLVVGGAAPAAGINFTNCWFWPKFGIENGGDFGFQTVNSSLAVVGSYLEDYNPLFWGFTNLVFLGNTVMNPVNSGANVLGLIWSNATVGINITHRNYVIDSNAYFGQSYLYTNQIACASWPLTLYPYLGTNGWTALGYDTNSTFAASVPTTNIVAVYTNKYDPSRGEIVIRNLGAGNSVAVNLSGILTNGSPYEVLNMQDLYGPPACFGTYNGGTVSIPMTDTSVMTPAGWTNLYPSTLPAFGCFLVLPQLPSGPLALVSQAELAAAVASASQSHPGQVLTNGNSTPVAVSNDWTVAGSLSVVGPPFYAATLTGESLTGGNGGSTEFTLQAAADSAVYMAGPPGMGNYFECDPFAKAYIFGPAGIFFYGDFISANVPNTYLSSLWASNRVSSASVNITTNDLSAWPSTPASTGAISLVNSNGTGYVLESGANGTLWTSTNLLLQVANGGGTPQTNITVLAPSGSITVSTSAPVAGVTLYTVGSSAGGGNAVLSANQAWTGSNDWQGLTTFAIPPVGSGAGFTNVTGANVSGPVPSATTALAGWPTTWALSALTQSGAGANQVPQWNGSAWAPATLTYDALNAALNATGGITAAFITGKLGATAVQNATTAAGGWPTTWALSSITGTGTLPSWATLATNIFDLAGAGTTAANQATGALSGIAWAPVGTFPTNGGAARFTTVAVSSGFTSGTGSNLWQVVPTNSGIPAAFISTNAGYALTANLAGATNLPASGIASGGSLPALNGSALTSVPFANLAGQTVPSQVSGVLTNPVVLGFDVSSITCVGTNLAAPAFAGLLHKLAWTNSATNLQMQISRGAWVYSPSSPTTDGSISPLNLAGGIDTTPLYFGFGFDGSYFNFGISGIACPVVIQINGKDYPPFNVDVAGTGNFDSACYYFKVQFASSGRRSIVLKTLSNNYASVPFLGVWIDPACGWWNSPPGRNYNFLVFGSSHTETPGTAQYTGNYGLPNVDYGADLMYLFKNLNEMPNGEGGTGVVNPGTRTNYIGRLATDAPKVAATVGLDAIGFEVSANDNYPSNQVYTNAVALLQLATNQYPTTPVFAFASPLWGSGQSSVAMSAFTNAMGYCGLSQSNYIDLVSDPVFPTGYNPAYQQTLGVHTTVAGAWVYADAIASKLGLLFPQLIPSGYTYPTTPLTVPTAFNAAPGSNTVALSWTAPLAGAASYNLKRNLSSGTETNYTNVVATSVTDTNTTNSTTYYYEVSAVSSAGVESANSYEVAATPTPIVSNLMQVSMSPKRWLAAYTNAFLDAGGSMSPTNGGKILRWNDSSGNGNHVVQAYGGANKWTNSWTAGQPAIGMNGTIIFTNWAPESGFAAPQTFVIIGQAKTEPVNESWFDSGAYSYGTNNLAFNDQSNGNLQLLSGNSFRQTGNNWLGTNTVWYLVSFNAASSYVMRNGTNALSATTITNCPVNGVTIGCRGDGNAGFDFSGYVAEFAEYTGVPTTSDIMLISNYCAVRYGIHN
jgi:hypothetical protein